jgi:heavy metal translocating P-type ATPase
MRKSRSAGTVLKTVLSGWLSNDPKITGICTAVSAVSLVLSLSGILRTRLPFDIAFAAVVLSGVPIVTGAVRALVIRHDIKADLLVSMALLSSIAIQEYFAAGEVALIMQIGSLLEDYTADRAGRGIEKLIRMTPRTARVRRGEADVVIPAEEVEVGDLVTVLAGETIPADGVLLSGEAAVDESAMTGEPIPSDKAAGDPLISGTVSCNGTFRMRVLKTCSDSSLQRMILLARQADAEKAPIVSLADRWAGWMVAAALGCAILAFACSGEPVRAVTVLVVFCPCAFVLATPTAVAAAIGNLTGYGVLVRSGEALQRFSAVDSVAFDKTGTLTEGRPSVVHVESFRTDTDETAVLRLFAAAEQCSEHPLGKAIMEKCGELQITVPPADGFRVLPGQGMEARTGGRTVLAGRSSMLPLTEEEKARTAVFSGQGAAVICVSADGEPYGFAALSDRLRTDSGSAVRKLQEMHIRTVLLTGDSQPAAAYAAAETGIREYRAGLLPEDKLKELRAMSDAGARVCMTGDGINDALAISAAYAGVAMGGIGSDIAVESADAVLVSDEIDRIPYLLKVSRKAMTKIRQNIILSMMINFTAVLLSVLGVLNPVSGAIVHNCGSVLVVVNAAFLLNMKDK